VADREISEIDLDVLGQVIREARDVELVRTWFTHARPAPSRRGDFSALTKLQRHLHVDLLAFETR